MINGVKEVPNIWLLKPPLSLLLSLSVMLLGGSSTDEADSHSLGAQLAADVSLLIHPISRVGQDLWHGFVFSRSSQHWHAGHGSSCWGKQPMKMKELSQKIVKACCSKALQRAWNVLCYPAWPSCWLSQTKEWNAKILVRSWGSIAVFLTIDVHWHAELAQPITSPGLPVLRCTHMNFSSPLVWIVSGFPNVVPPSI